MGGTNDKPVARVQPKRAVGTTRQRPRNAKGDAAGARSFPCIVGVGASAGGFDALVEFLHVLPSNSGLSFIILQHLSPSPRSLSAELFSRHTTMRVSAAEEGMRLEANCVYTTPADKDIRVKGGRIRLSRPAEGRGHRLPVDQLFRSLGQDQRERAVGIILSGTGSDGSLGLKEIIVHGGIVLVQAPETAQFDGMPRSALATGLVSYVLPIPKMARILVSYASHAYVRAPSTFPARSRGSNPTLKILKLLEVGHGQSFSGYKQAMLLRRIERRMGLLNIEKLDEYAKRLMRDAAEVTALRKDLLIGVTEFFRDPQAWSALDTEVLRTLIAAKKPGEPIRAWVAGGGTGEEAYTLAILILARLRKLRKRCAVQIFATDANEDSLNYARAGSYPAGIAKQISAGLLKRYFQQIKGDHHYQVIPEVRESVIFGEHDLLADPPYSRLDLVTCRNLLIYIEPVTQERILLLCHFALRPGGYLFLGSAETVGVHAKLFKIMVRKWHIYQRIGTTPREQIDWQVGATKIRPASVIGEPLTETGRAAPLATPTRDEKTAVAKTRGAHSRLQQELRATQEDLQSAVSQLKSSNEELRASHEETMSINEELQSMNEELESSKEELQSVNEELNTVNTQLQSKVGELEVANSDLRNLLASNEVATFCLDRSLRIKWFTPAAHRLFNLLQSDIGRPIADLSLSALDSTLIEHARLVLQSHGSQSREFEHNAVYLRRIVPYRADGTQIAGVVITFTDITEAKRAAQQEIEAKAALNELLEERVRKRTEELERLARELALAEVRERQTIARDLHDGLGQELNAASIKLDALRGSHETTRLHPALDEIARLLEGVVREMRSLTAQLNPPVLEQLGLVAAIEWLSEEMRKTYQLEVLLEDDMQTKSLDSVAASILFRAVRELLINVTRHANVKIARVVTSSADGYLTVKVADHGVGFALPGKDPGSSPGLGLSAMRERIAHIGGTFVIKSERNRGTTATIQVPMSPP
ncbi:MAG TPA: chemotaxis protein CheB [Steroidobacteraceae bacterium]|nr:chemotaxis protein CheB [Steroidobacteraceae bacterium]